MGRSPLGHYVASYAADAVYYPRGEGREDKNKDRKLREAKAEARKRGLVLFPHTTNLRHDDKGVDATEHGSRFRGGLGAEDSTQWGSS